MEVEEQIQIDEDVVLAEFDMDDMPKQTHRWIDRGIVMSCEDAGHANHRHYKRQVRK